MVERTVTGRDMGLEALSDPESDLFISKTENIDLSGAKDLCLESTTKTFWIADTDNNRILRLDENLKVTGCYKTLTGTEKTSFNSPQGVFPTVDENGDTIIYVADSKNARAVKVKITGNLTAEVVTEYTKPGNQAYTSESFAPSKILIDNQENVYLVCTSVNTGALRYANDGEFQGFYGANRVEQTAEVIARKVWRVFASQEQLEAMTSSAPSEFHNFDIDDKGFIYTVTETANASTDAVKKLNPAGYNIWDNSVGNEYEFGDFAWGSDENSAISTKLTDIAIGDNGVINILDYQTGRVFQYDEDVNLLFIFGTKSTPSQQEGSFCEPNAIETLGTKVYVLDGTKNDVTVFAETTFGSYVHEASVLYVEGKYTEAKPLWEEVMRRDGGYTLAHIALGKAAVNEGEYELAMEYFETAYDQENYDKAYEYYRDDFLRDHFETIVISLLVIIVLILVVRKLKKKGILKPLSEYVKIIAGKIKPKKSGKGEN